ncbi:MAG: 3-methyl-2-oxobutanoate hydroxymethyltransferase [Desulfovibrionaceae bacterium]
MQKNITVPLVKAAKGQRKLSMLTAYDYPSALLVDQSGVDMVLVGDSLAMVVLGHEDTLSVTMDEMLHHCKAARRGVSRALLVADMPFMSYEIGGDVGVAQAVANAGRFFKEAGVRAVKVEGAAGVLPQVRAMVGAGMPVMGHVGLTPQRVAEFGGFKVQGKTAAAAEKIIADAVSLDEAGCFAMVLEAIPSPIAAEITRRVSIPTIGIGAGPDCDGQVLVFHDILGLYDRFVPKFVKQYATLAKDVRDACVRYREAVEAGEFPGPEHSFAMAPAPEMGEGKDLKLYGGEKKSE